MKLITFQSYDALKSLINKGYLECNEKYINIPKMHPTYSWIIEKMQTIANPTNAKYPLWAWVKCYNSICPPKHQGQPVPGFDVKITFHKNKKDILITDFRRYSFLLNNTYIPITIQDKHNFDNQLKTKNITEEELKAYVRPDKYPSHRQDQEYLDVCKQIRNSFDRCITEDSDILQGCIWRINLSEVEKIEILTNKDYCYGSLNYKKANGKRTNWREDFYKKLK